MIRKVVYTDGACIGNPGPGGWGWYVPDTGESASGGSRETTNNRMELIAVIEALKTFTLPSGGSFFDGELVIYSDSKYIVDCFRQNWWKGWIARGWKTTSKTEVKNQDLWKELLDIVQSSAENNPIEFLWVKGHSGDPGNEEADRLAAEAAEKAAAI